MLKTIYLAVRQSALAIIAMLGAFVQMVGHFAQLYSYFEDPLRSYLVVVIGFLVSVIALFRSASATTVCRSSVLLASGERLEKRRFKYSLRLRIIAWLGLGVIVSSFLFHTYHLLTSRPVELIADIDKDKAYPVKSQLLSMTQVHAVERLGGGAYAEIDGTKHPLAIIGQVPGQLHDAPCAIQIHLEPQPRFDWIVVDAVQVRVKQWRELPDIQRVVTLPYESATVYFATIDAGGQRALFDAMPSGEQPGVLRIERGAPEPLVVHVDADTPGIYVFDVLLRVRANGTRESVVVTENEEWCFARRLQ